MRTEAPYWPVQSALWVDVFKETREQMLGQEFLWDGGTVRQRDSATGIEIERGVEEGEALTVVRVESNPGGGDGLRIHVELPGGSRAYFDAPSKKAVEVTLS